MPPVREALAVLIPTPCPLCVRPPGIWPQRFSVTSCTTKRSTSTLSLSSCGSHPTSARPQPAAGLNGVSASMGSPAAPSLLNPTSWGPLAGTRSLAAPCCWRDARVTRWMTCAPASPTVTGGCNASAAAARPCSVLAPLTHALRPALCHKRSMTPPAAAAPPGPRPRRLNRISHDDVWALITACWSQDPAQRPSMAAVATQLALIKEGMEAAARLGRGVGPRESLSGGGALGGGASTPRSALPRAVSSNRWAGVRRHPHHCRVCLHPPALLLLLYTRHCLG